MPANKGKILVVEDEKAMAHALELKLKHEGYDALAVFNGEEGLEKLEKEKFDLILCDLVMPKVDGFRFLEELKNKKIKTPVIILTNLSQEEDEKRVKTLGATDFFVKSNTSLKDIVDHVKHILK